MTLFQIISVLITLSAVFSYVNHRFIKLPTTIGILAIAMVFSLALTMGGLFGLDTEARAQELIGSIDFNEALMNGMLSFLLFAGALHVNLSDLADEKWTIGIMATAGVVMSTFLAGSLAYWILGIAGIELPYIYCLVFGALISPTDPIAVLGILKSIGAPKPLETRIAGESLFNDGVGVVVFIVIAGVASGTDEATVEHVAALFGQEAVGGLIFGLGLGFISYGMLKSIDNYQVEALVTLAVVTGGYALAMALHLSGPIAVVVAGLFIGNHGRLLAMSDTTRDHLDKFWELIDEILNAVLFVLIGLEVLIISYTAPLFLASLVLIVAVLFSRFVCVGIPIKLLSLGRDFGPRTIRILTWGGLRGGISVALALSLPTGPERDVIVPITYVVVVFSILVQGLTVSKLIPRQTATSTGPAN